MRVIDAHSLRLEPQAVEHAQEMFRVLSDPALYEYENEAPPSAEWLRERFAKLESRQSPDGRDQWLNWVIRVPSSELIGYVQATVGTNGHASIAYELASRYWGRGLAREAVQAMITELVDQYRVRCLSAVFRRQNLRSVRLLTRLGFALVSPERHVERALEDGESLMQLEIGPASKGARPIVEFRQSPAVEDEALNKLFTAAWPGHVPRSFQPTLSRSLAYICAYRAGELVGFVNLAWDGQCHAFLLDTTVRPEDRRQGSGVQLVRHALEAARAAGIEWVHVDFEPHLREFYRRCGFVNCEAGVVNVARSI